MSEMYLAHHGRLGQKWGKRNGPPYPLDYKKLSPEERAKAKDSAISTGNIKEANANVDYFNNRDIEEVINRYRKKAELRGLSEKDLKTGKKVIEDLIEKANLFVRVTETGIKVYNNVAKISNAITKGTTGQNGKLPIVGEGGGDNKNDKNKNKGKH